MICISWQTHMLATQSKALEREHIIGMLLWVRDSMQAYCTQNVGMKCPTPLYQEMNYIKFSLWTYPTTVLTSESWLVLRTITAGPPLGRESKSLFCNQTYRGQEAKSHQFSFYHHENPTSHSLGILNHMPYTSLVHEANQIRYYCLQVRKALGSYN